MITIPEAFKVQYDKEVEMYLAEIDRLKRKSISAKKTLLTDEFYEYPDAGSERDKQDYFNSIADFVFDLVLFPEEEITQKLRVLKLKNTTLKWMVNLEDLTNEIDRLTNVEGLFILPHKFLFAANAHLCNRFLIGMLNDLGQSTFYNNQHTNVLFVDFDKRFKRREYNQGKNQTQKMNTFERRMNYTFDRVEAAIPEDGICPKKLLLQSAKGNTSYYIRIFDNFECDGISKNKAYRELFPLVKLIVKDSEMLDYDEYTNRKDAFYDADYSKYQIARVKKILQIN